MRTFTTYLAATALAVGSIGFLGCDKDSGTTTTSTKTTTTTNTPDNRTAGDKVGDTANQAANSIKGAGQKIGETIKNAGGRFTDDNSAIRHMLGDVVDASMTKDGFESVRERLVDADRNRIDKVKLTDDQKKTLNEKVATLQQAWQSKYGKKFDVDKEDELYAGSFLAIALSEIPKGAAGADVTVKEKADGTVKTDVDSKTGVDKPDTNAADTNKNDPGRNVATATIAASHGAPELKIPLIHEAGGWKIDAPDTVGTTELYTNLSGHIDEVVAMRDKWPDDINEGYRTVTHHILMGVMGQAPGTK